MKSIYFIMDNSEYIFKIKEKLVERLDQTV
jgi:hypothetical protein